MAGELVVVYNLLPEIAAKVEEMADKAIRKAAFEVVAASMAAAPVGPTGFLKNSHYVELSGSDGGTNEHSYSAVQSPQADQTLLPEVDKPTEKHTAIVAVGASYATFVEYGTVHMPARPFLTPAVELVAPQLLRAYELIFSFMEANAL